MESTATTEPSTTLRDQLLASRLAAARRLSPEQQRRAALLVGGALLALLLLVLLADGFYARRYDGRVYRGVRVGQVPLSGLTRAEALARLDERAAAYLVQPAEVGVRSSDERWQVAPVDLGVQVDTAAAVDAALAVGRDGLWPGSALSRLGALLGGRQVVALATLDEARLEAALLAWAPAVSYRPTDARFVPGPDGRLTIDPDKDGLGLAVEGSREAFLNHAGRLASSPVVLPQAPVPTPINRQLLQSVEPQAQAIVAEPLTVRHAGQAWTLAPEQLRTVIAYRLDGDQPVVALDREGMRPFVQEIARAVRQPGVNAKLVVDPQGRYAVHPHQDGLALDEAETLAAIDAALTGGAHEAVAVVKPQPPPIVAADLEPVRARAEQLAGTQLVVTFKEYRRLFVRSDIQPLLVFTERPNAPEKVAITLDPAGLRRITQVLANDLNQGMRNAQFKWVDGMVRDVAGSQEGREVQFAATDAALQQAILGATGTATPHVAVTPPVVDSAQKAQMGPFQRLAYGATYYGFSTADRAHNVELAMQRLDGILVPPGGLFSFNREVGAQTTANGYKEGYAIALVGGTGGGTGQIKTVPAVAGGICQVSTTLFHAVFRAGLSIEERNWHLYWITSYGGPPSGLQGLDATVYDDVGLDFQFVNNTGGWLAIETVADGAYARIALYGKDPGWQVVIDEPVITNIRKADPKPVREKTHTLPPGQEVQVETATDGFDAAIRRRVLDGNGKVLLDTTFKSSYQPSRNVTLVGVPPDEPLD